MRHLIVLNIKKGQQKDSVVIISLQCQALFVMLREMAEKTIKQRADYHLDAVSAHQLDRWSCSGVKSR